MACDNGNQHHRCRSQQTLFSFDTRRSTHLTTTFGNTTIILYVLFGNGTRSVLRKHNIHYARSAYALDTQTSADFSFLDSSGGTRNSRWRQYIHTLRLLSQTRTSGSLIIAFGKKVDVSSHGSTRHVVSGFITYVTHVWLVSWIFSRVYLDHQAVVILFSEGSTCDAVIQIDSFHAIYFSVICAPPL